jgi:hypothetical protein
LIRSFRSAGVYGPCLRDGYVDCAFFPCAAALCIKVIIDDQAATYEAYGKVIESKKKNSPQVTAQRSYVSVDGYELIVIKHYWTLEFHLNRKSNP